MELPSEMFVAIVGTNDTNDYIYGASVKHTSIKDANGFASRVLKDSDITSVKIGRVTVRDCDQPGYKGCGGKMDIDQVIVDLIQEYDRLLEAKFQDDHTEITGQKAKIKTRLLQWVGRI